MEKDIIIMETVHTIMDLIMTDHTIMDLTMTDHIMGKENIIMAVRMKS